MKEGTEEYIKAANQIMELFCMGEGKLLAKYYTEDVEFITPNSRKYGKEMELYLQQSDRQRVTNKNYRLIYHSRNAGIVTGYCVKDEGIKLDITMALLRTCEGVRLKYIHISKPVSDHYFMVRDTREKVYRISKADIIYLESFHNHVIWHCRNKIMESVGQLSEIEKKLPVEFVRIHRSYIVNRSHVVLVARCFVRLDNEEILQIPVKKYCGIKEKLARDFACDPIP